MKVSLKITLCLSLLLFLSIFCTQIHAHNNSIEYLSIKGTSTDLEAGTLISLEEINNKTTRETTTVDEKGNFTLRKPLTYQTLGKLKVHLGKRMMGIILVLEPAEMSLHINGKQAGKYTISGSEASQEIKTFMTDIMKEEQRGTYCANYIETTDNVWGAYFALNYLNINENLTSFQTVAERLKKEHPASPITQKLYERVGNRKATSAVAAGVVLSDICLPSANNQDVSLSNLNGKVTLVHFWASWAPCTASNQELVKLYNKYQDKGFEIYSISLDSDKERWQSAIKKQRLVWKNHVSELTGWESSAVEQYGINTLPANILLNEKGHVVGKNLKASALEIRLQSLLKK